jgi:hypothetical protein
MARIRKIARKPELSKNYFLVDACFLANKYIPSAKSPNPLQKQRIARCMDWSKEIDAQVKAGCARVYVPDICIAEAFKVLAKKYYDEHWFTSAVDLNNARLRFRKEVCLPASTLRAANRKIAIHDISTNRDIILAVDRFYEGFLKYKLRVSLPDLIILATAKYIMDFYDIPKNSVQIITMDKALWEGSKKISNVPHCYDPTRPADAASGCFNRNGNTPNKSLQLSPNALLRTINSSSVEL